MEVQKMAKVRCSECSLIVSCHRSSQEHLLILGLLCLLIFSSVAERVAVDAAATSDEISVLAVGDITVSSRMTPLIERRGAGLFFEGTAALIQSADVATAS